MKTTTAFLTRPHGKNVTCLTHRGSDGGPRFAYTEDMRRKTPPGFYFVLLVAVVSFVAATGLTRLPVATAGVDNVLAPSGHNRIGVYLTSYATTKPSIMEALYAAREAGQIDAVVINVKNMHGEVTYDSHIALAHEIGATTGVLDVPSLLQDLHARGFYVIARQVVFYDPLLAAHLGRTDEWAPCDDPRVREYNLDIAEEVASMGFDELQFDYVRYPDGGELEDIYSDRFEAITSFLAEANARLGDALPLSADLFGRVMWPWNSRRIDPIGQSLEDMAPQLAYVTPMLYPSHYVEQVYKDDPYRTVQDALSSGKNRVQADFRPFLQAFDRDIPAGMSLEIYINEQIRAARDYGADGYLFWNPACEYAPLFDVLEPASD